MILWFYSNMGRLSKQGHVFTRTSPNSAEHVNISNLYCFLLYFDVILHFFSVCTDYIKAKLKAVDTTVYITSNTYLLILNMAPCAI